MRGIKGLLAVTAGLMLLLHAGGATAYADDRGNNGTIKIHETANDNDHENENDPHVCTFHITGMKFDASSSGTWHIDRWAPTGSGLQSSGTWSADATGYWRSVDMTLPDGHYKAFAKQTSPATSGDDKQKVFWVKCASSSSTGSSGSTGTTGASGATGENSSSAASGSNAANGATGASGATASSGFGQTANNVPVQTGSNMAGGVSPNTGQNMGMGVTPGVASLPSTSTLAPTTPLGALGVFLMALGVFLLRRPVTRPQ